MSEPGLAPNYGIGNAPRLPRRLVAGLDCMPSHDPPPQSICSGDLCQEWMQRAATPARCSSEHAHGAHYWTGTDQAFWSCPGRPYCSPRFFEAAE